MGHHGRFGRVATLTPVPRGQSRRTSNWAPDAARLLHPAAFEDQ
ncbi:MAG: hypothetical protein ACRDZO_08260 [Egibacteraceae bacterium]